MARLAKDELHRGIDRVHVELARARRPAAQHLELLAEAVEPRQAAAEEVRRQQQAEEEEGDAAQVVGAHVAEAQCEVVVPAPQPGQPQQSQTDGAAP